MPHVRTRRVPFCLSNTTTLNLSKKLNPKSGTSCGCQLYCLKSCPVAMKSVPRKIVKDINKSKKRNHPSNIYNVNHQNSIKSLSNHPGMFTSRHKTAHLQNTVTPHAIASGLPRLSDRSRIPENRPSICTWRATVGKPGLFD